MVRPTASGAFMGICGALLMLLPFVLPHLSKAASAMLFDIAALFVASSLIALGSIASCSCDLNGFRGPQKGVTAVQCYRVLPRAADVSRSSMTSSEVQVRMVPWAAVLQ